MGSVILNALRGNVESPGALMQRNPTTDIVPGGLARDPLLVPSPEGPAQEAPGLERAQGPHAVGRRAAERRA